MDTSKLKPNDSRVKNVSATINGKTIKYILGEPQGAKKDTMFLIHGFPDMGFGWRYQIPYFMSLGYQVVVPDMIGYGGTDAPQDLNLYGQKQIAADVKALATQFVGENGQIVLGGHDWGGMVVWRTSAWYPELIKSVFSICTPFMAPSTTYTKLEDAVASGVLKNFTYQLQLMGPDVEKNLQGEEKVRQFLNAMYGGRGPNGEVGFTVTKGVLFDNLDKLGPNPLLSKEELDYYVEQYMLRDAPQLRGPLNWYRTREINFEDEKVLAEKDTKLYMPAMFVMATDDAALPPWMSKGMEDNFASFTRGEVKASHWALWEAPDSVNQQVGDWLQKVSDGSIKASL